LERGVVTRDREAVNYFGSSFGRAEQMTARPEGAKGVSEVVESWLGKI
jgi:hypothetical protein